MCPSGNNPEDSWPESVVHTRLRLNFGSPFSRRSPVGSKAFARSPVGITRCSMLGWRRANGSPPRRHIGVTCGASRAPMVGRCSRERRLIRSAGAPKRRSLNRLRHTVTGRRGLLTRPSLLFCVEYSECGKLSACASASLEPSLSQGSGSDRPRQARSVRTGGLGTGWGPAVERTFPCAHLRHYRVPAPHKRQSR
jgi:hypothetical protein